MRQSTGFRQSGIGLIEVLVTVVILSMGFLAAARMQVEGTRFSQSAYYSSQAHFIANDIADRMRSNIRGVIEGAYTNRSTTAAPAVDPGCLSKSCSASDLADQDIYDWADMLHPTDTASVAPLPSSSGESPIIAKAEISENTPNLYTIAVTWSETINGKDEAQSLILNFVTEEFN